MCALGVSLVTPKMWLESTQDKYAIFSQPPSSTQGDAYHAWPLFIIMALLVLLQYLILNLHLSLKRCFLGLNEHVNSPIVW